MKDKEKHHPKDPTPAAGERAAEEAAPEDKPREDTAPAQDPARELEETKKRMAYLAAEFDNYRKRAAREKESLIAYGNEKLLRAVLPFLDNLERAMSQAVASGSVEGLISGVRLTYNQFLSELKKFGLEQISTEGETFDPTLHEAIAQMECEGKAEGAIVSEARKGYTLNGRLLRPAQVVVAKGEQSSSAGGEDEAGRIIGLDD
jgi:molecular chaperone GrpE